MPGSSLDRARSSELLLLQVLRNHSCSATDARWSELGSGRMPATPAVNVLPTATAPTAPGSSLTITGRRQRSATEYEPSQTLSD
jgi:hypothetical protein